MAGRGFAPFAGRSKFNAQKTEIDGIVFASKAEATRYSQLKVLLESGIIRNLELQPKFPIIVNGTKVATYIADFAYFTDTTRTVEDVKGMITPVYRMKKKLVEALYPGMIITEIGRCSKRCTSPKNTAVGVPKKAKRPAMSSKA